MNYKLSNHALDVVENRGILLEWIDHVLHNPTREDTISSIESHFFSPITQNDNRCLKVVINPTALVAVTVYFDRGMRKRGCK